MRTLPTPFRLILTISILSMAPAASGEEKTHVCKPGDSVARIANFYGVSQRDLRDANGLGKGSFIDVGDRLIIPEVLRDGGSKGHRVKTGDTLVKIAKKYKVPVPELKRVNHLGKKARLKIGRVLLIPGKGDDTGGYARSTKGPDPVKSGKRVKGGVLHTVQPGQSLWTIARAYNTSGDLIAKRNNFSKEDPLNVGQEILIPGAKGVVGVKGRGFVAPPVRFVRVHSSKRVSLRLLNRKGRVNNESRRILSKLCRDRRGKKRFRLLHPRLVHMLQRVAEQFPGETIEIVSGYRAPRRGHRLSKHSRGQAIDFKVSGVPNKTLYEFVKSLPNVGAGYYPNSTFVHMDVRDKPFTWTDVSGPGEAPRYLDVSEDGLIEAKADAETDLELPEDGAP